MTEVAYFSVSFFNTRLKRLQFVVGFVEPPLGVWFSMIGLTSKFLTHKFLKIFEREIFDVDISIRSKSIFVLVTLVCLLKHLIWTIFDSVPAWNSRDFRETRETKIVMDLQNRPWSEKTIFYFGDRRCRQKSVGCRQIG